MIRCPDCGQPIKNPIRNMAMKELQKYNPKLKQVCEHCAHVAEKKSLIVMRRKVQAVKIEGEVSL